MPIRAFARVAAVAIVAAAWSAEAKVPDFFAKVERIDVEPYFARLAKVRVFLNVVTMQGQVLGNVAPTDLTLYIDGNKQKQVPGILPFDATGDPVDLVVVLETGVRFAPALDTLGDPLYDLLSKLPRSTFRAAVVTYGGDSLHTSGLGEPLRAARYLRNVSAEDTYSPPALIEAMKRAIRLLKGASLPASGRVPRRVIFVISDGSNNDEEGDGLPPESVQEDFNALIKQALEAGVTIDTLAFSINDRRGPFKNLGQMSKKTAGTFRWASSRADFAPMIGSFTTELRRQLVLTYFIPPAAIVGKSVKVVCSSAGCGAEPLASNERRAPEPTCGGHECATAQACIAEACVSIPSASGTGGRGMWIAILAVLGVGAVGAVVLVRRRKARHEEEEAAAAPPPVIAPQVVVPDFSNIPYLANNPQLQAQMAHLRSLGVAVGGQPQAQAPAAGRPQAQPAAPQAMPTTRARVLVLNGPRQGQQFPLRHGFTIGRVPGCDLVLEDPYTSSHHAQIHVDMAGGCTVVDLGSSSGTFVNGVRAQQQRLTHGTSVRVGQTEIRFLQG